MNKCTTKERIMSSDLVTKEYCSFDTLKHLKSMIDDLDDIKSDVANAWFLTQEYNDTPWEIKYLVNKCMEYITTVQDYLTTACDICRTDLTNQSDGADK